MAVPPSSNGDGQVSRSDVKPPTSMWPCLCWLSTPAPERAAARGGRGGGMGTTMGSSVAGGDQRDGGPLVGVTAADSASAEAEVEVEVAEKALSAAAAASRAADTTEAHQVPHSACW